MRSLEFVPPAENAFVDAVAKALGAGRRVQLQESGPLAIQVTRRLRAQIADIVIEPSASAADPAPVVALCETDGDKLTAELMEQMDRPKIGRAHV